MQQELVISYERRVDAYAEFPRPAKRPAYSALENRHLSDTIGDSMRDWKEALDSFLVSYLKQENQQ
ncbi:sugar nucleotide-binding protein [Sphaerochaeta sp.]|uniref:sugar nucleotide-binding protein n=1 Tax=Sphaerochaeta sp. TaxID=1972642 RepID=UPI002A359905|nr:sugar nucleotide-binding protein [Sphaerochaeta sp.]MDX9985465.1 sugar nucleotide-binding protein [Sphaerochaeta sp.]